MLISELDYHLPDELIAQEPLPEREYSRLLVLHKDSGDIEHRRFYNLPEYLNTGDALIVNDTKVSALRLNGKKAVTGVNVEVFLLKPLGNNHYEALVKPGRRLTPGVVVEFGEGLKAVIKHGTDFGGRVIEFLSNGETQEKIAQLGLTPLPPYVHKMIQDAGRYQTVYGKTDGSAAASTAGLHFSQSLLSEIKNKGVVVGSIRLDISLDTFRPVKTEILEEHPIHGETMYINQKTADIVQKCNGKIIAVGTTSVRALESAACGFRRIEPQERSTSIFITPGWKFQIIDGMITNFHMPKTTMLAMVSALAGYDNLKRAYQIAVEQKYRFLSFGDAMLIV